MRNAGAHTLTHGADAAALLSILSGGGSLTVLGGGLLLVLRGRGDGGAGAGAARRVADPGRRRDRRWRHLVSASTCRQR